MESNIQSVSGLKKADFQREINGKKVDLFFLRNANGMEVAITNYGGSIVAIMVPDKNGKFENVIQGHDNLEDCVNSPEPFCQPWLDAMAIVFAKASSRSTERNITSLSITALTICMAALLVSMLAFGMQNRLMTARSC